ncbi:CDP-glycerol glycerophosphotransferase family protein [Rossellomorea marisflavi]|uniref:CDP-glycerol glycerophosphotransferase family protein n=1 Tax=Rossellomorea marisflavi TaxID=189381 RepID=UPI0034596C51
MIFALAKGFPIKKKVVFVVSFSENNQRIWKEMMRQDVPCRVIFLATDKMYPIFSREQEAETLLFEVKNPVQFLKGIYHLATSKVVLVDNYYGFMAVSDFKKEVTCIQLWHANGAIKKFGLQDPSNEMRSAKAISRFKKVYAKFNKIIVGSEAMADVFREAFGAKEEQFARTGIPRTDPFFDKPKQRRIVDKLYGKFPYLRGKKVVLYAPTYREQDLVAFRLQLDLEKIVPSLPEGMILLVKLHPAVRDRMVIPEAMKDKVFDVSTYAGMNELLFVSDILITDYSSIPFEYSLLGKPMIFYLYDHESYLMERGVWEDYKTSLPGPVAYTTQEVTSILLENSFNEKSASVGEFCKKWNQYSHGHSSTNVVNLINDSLR